MKTKALVLGAHPPFEGPWISLEGAESWNVVVVEGNEENITLHTTNNGGPLKNIRFGDGECEASSVRVLLDPVIDEEKTTVYVESVEE